MESSVRKIYEESKCDLEFQLKLKESGEDYHTPSFWWDEETKMLFATIYMGYLLALGKFKDSNYK